MENKKIIRLLQQFHLPSKDIAALEQFISRDGFQVITDEDLDGMLDFFRQYPDDFEEILPIITDGNSNYLCVYYKGTFSGQVCYLSHNGMNLSPQYNDITHLITVIHAHPEAWDFMDIQGD